MTIHSRASTQFYLHRSVYVNVWVCDCNREWKSVRKSKWSVGKQQQQKSIEFRLNHSCIKMQDLIWSNSDDSSGGSSVDHAIIISFDVVIVCVCESAIIDVCCLYQLSVVNFVVSVSVCAVRVGLKLCVGVFVRARDFILADRDIADSLQFRRIDEILGSWLTSSSSKLPLKFNNHSSNNTTSTK